MPPHTALTYCPSSTFVGALGQAFTSDRFGRRGSILIWSAIFTVGTAIQTSTVTSLAQITIGRFIAGLGVGALSAIVPLYNGETAPKAMRGMLLVLYQLQIIIGYVFIVTFTLRYADTVMQYLPELHHRPRNTHNTQLCFMAYPCWAPNALGSDSPLRDLLPPRIPVRGRVSCPMYILTILSQSSFTWHR